MNEITVRGVQFRLTDDAGKHAAACALSAAGRLDEAELLRRSVGLDKTNIPCQRQPTRVTGGVVVAWPAPRLVTAVERDGGTVDVVTEYGEVSGMLWESLTDREREQAEALLAAIHAANVEVARSPAAVRNQFWQTLPENIAPAEYPSVAREWLEAARRDVAALGLA